MSDLSDIVLSPEQRQKLREHLAELLERARPLRRIGRRGWFLGYFDDDSPV